VGVVRLLTEKGASPKLEGAFEKQEWGHAADRKDAAMLRYFVERGMPFDAELGQHRTNAVLVAAERGDLDALKEFVKKGADLKKKGPGVE
ncbi:hypothetical protein, partial [Salmonella sp. SAL4436]|uniref:hypothetical protein n=1 Tax=Salmonella sp. SAL4436 TaxID=3159891 RepID=UPI00397C578D